MRVGRGLLPHGNTLWALRVPRPQSALKPRTFTTALAVMTLKVTGVFPVCI